MGMTNSFKFLDDDLQQRLLVGLGKANIRHAVGKDGTVRYAAADEQAVENEVLRSIRDEVFSSWQVLTCPPEWVFRYKRYMTDHGIPFHEELSKGELWFLLPRKYRPHRWKLEGPATPDRLAM